MVVLPAVMSVLEHVDIRFGFIPEKRVANAGSRSKVDRMLKVIEEHGEKFFFIEIKNPRVMNAFETDDRNSPVVQSIADQVSS